MISEDLIHRISDGSPRFSPPILFPWKLPYPVSKKQLAPVLSQSSSLSVPPCPLSLLLPSAHALVGVRQTDSAAGERGMISKPSPPAAETSFAAKNADGADASNTSDRGAVQRGPNHGSEGLCDGASGPAAAASTATGGVDMPCAAAAAAAVKKPMPRRRDIAIKGLDILVDAEPSPAETSARCVLRPFLIRSLARQKELNNGGVLTKMVMSPPAAREPAADKLPRRVVVAQGSPPRASLDAAVPGAAAKARTAGTAGPEVYLHNMLMSEALSPASEPLRGGSSRSTAIEKFSEALEISANNNKDSATRRGWHRCRWAGKLLEGYSEALETRPLTFKCVTSALVGALGDAAAQAVFWAIRGGGNAVWHDAKVSPQ